MWYFIISEYIFIARDEVVYDLIMFRRLAGCMLGNEQFGKQRAFPFRDNKATGRPFSSPSKG
jgi:hypothetical protein